MGIITQTGNRSSQTGSAATYSPGYCASDLPYLTIYLSHSSDSALELVEGYNLIKKLMGAAATAAVITGATGIFAAVPAANAAPDLYLPFPANVSTVVTNYPHGTTYGYWAVDFGLPRNASVVASAAGVVKVAAYMGGAYAANGLHVLIDHGGNYCTQYNHLQSESVTVGQTVSRGQQIGTVGSTGLTSAGWDSTTSGQHLHWDRVNCDTRLSVGPASTVEYGSFYVGQTVVSQNSVATPPPAANPSIKSAGDLVAVNAAGKLLDYGSSAPLSPREIGNGFFDLTSIHVTDWNNDGTFDLLAQWDNGTLSAFYGNPSGGFTRVDIGNGWQNMDIQVAKWDKSNPFPGVIFRDTLGKFFYYENADGRKFGTKTEIGNGWTTVSDFTVTDWDNDGKQDVVAIKTADNNMYVYPGDGAGGFTGSSSQIGNGWAGYKINGITNFYGASKSVIGIESNGNLYNYPILPSAFGARQLVGNGWNTVMVAGH